MVTTYKAPYPGDKISSREQQGKKKMSFKHYLLCRNYVIIVFKASAGSTVGMCQMGTGASVQGPTSKINVMSTPESESCFPWDTWLLYAFGPEELRLLGGRGTSQGCQRLCLFSGSPQHQECGQLLWLLFLMVSTYISSRALELPALFCSLPYSW